MFRLGSIGNSSTHFKLMKPIYEVPLSANFLCVRRSNPSLKRHPLVPLLLEANKKHGPI